MTWKNGKLANAAIRSTLGGNCIVRTPGAIRVQANGQDVGVTRPAQKIVEFNAEPGKSYVLLPSE